MPTSRRTPAWPRRTTRGPSTTVRNSRTTWVDPLRRLFLSRPGVSPCDPRAPTTGRHRCSASTGCQSAHPGSTSHRPTAAESQLRCLSTRSASGPVQCTATDAGSTPTPTGTPGGRVRPQPLAVGRLPAGRNIGVIGVAGRPRGCDVRDVRVDVVGSSHCSWGEGACPAGCPPSSVAGGPSTALRWPSRRIGACPWMIPRAWNSTTFAEPPGNGAGTARR